ncbi:MAG: protein kinase [Vicinamibacteria bacterium]
MAQIGTEGQPFDSPGSAPVFRAIAEDESRGLDLRTRLFLGSVLLLIFTIGAPLAFLSKKSQSVAEQKIREDLNAVPAIFEGYSSTQQSAREHAVRSLAEEPGTKALLAEVREHPETFHDSAEGFAKVLGARSVFLFDMAGLLLARSDRPVGDETGRDFSGISWVDTPRLSKTETSAYILEVTQGHALSLIAAAPVSQGRELEQRLTGVIAAAFEVSGDRAKELALLTAGEIAFVANVAPDGAPPQLELMASTKKFSLAMPQGMRDAATDVFEKGTKSEPSEFSANGETFIATALPIRSGSGRVLAALVVGRSKDAEMAPFLEIRRSLLVVGVIALLLSIPLSFAMAQGLAAPIQKLAEGARKIARGELDVSLPSVGGEVGALSRAFESMVGELKEKAQLEALVANMQRRPGDITFRGGLAAIGRDGVIGHIGQVFANRYEIVSELGKGGMGVVYRVRDRELDEEVALKVLTSVGEEQAIQVDRLRQEIKLARAITHQNVVRAFDFGEADGARFLTMEYVPGTTLREVIDARGGLEMTPALQIAKQICRGLAAVHKAGIIHGDLKPQNVMVMGNGVAKLMDFGVARTRANQDHGGVSVVGTPLYMSPEQAKGADLDERSDIYSAGVVMYEMFTGECPFRGRDVTEILQMHLNDTPADPRTLRPEIPASLSEMILACLSKHRAQRPATAVDLDRWLMRVRV